MSSSESTNKFNIRKSINYVFAIVYTILWSIITWYFGIGSLGLLLDAFSVYNFFFQLIALGIGLITPIFCIATMVYIWKFYKLQNYALMHCCNFIPIIVSYLALSFADGVLSLARFTTH